MEATTYAVVIGALGVISGALKGYYETKKRERAEFLETFARAQTQIYQERWDQAREAIRNAQAKARAFQDAWTRNPAPATIEETKAFDDLRSAIGTGGHADRNEQGG